MMHVTVRSHSVGNLLVSTMHLSFEHCDVQQYNIVRSYADRLGAKCT